MWPRRLLELFGQDAPLADPVVLVCPPEAGAATLIAALETPDLPLVWCDLSAEDGGNPHRQGAKLAAAVNAKLGRGLLPGGLEAADGLAALTASLDLLTPLAIALQNAHYAPEFAAALLALHRPGCRVVVQTERLPETAAWPEGVRVLGTAALRLTLPEASELADGRLPEPEVAALCRETGGLYERFMTALHRRLELPPHLTPSPAGPRPLTGPRLEPTALLELLVRKGRWPEALEVAVYNLPERVPETLATVGHHLHAAGLHGRLYMLLDNLPETVRTHETVLLWRFRAAFYLGRVEQMMKDVESHLEQHEAPELRASYAGIVVPYDLALRQAERAYRAEKTPFTAFQFGRLLLQPEAVALLKEAVALAEANGHPYEVVRNAGALAAKLVSHGSYQEAAAWGDLALKAFAQHGLKDAQRQLRIVNEWAYARLMTGATAGLEGLLREHERRLSASRPDLAALFRGTLGDYLMAHARPAEALHYYRVNVEAATRDNFAEAALKMVRGQLELGEFADALTAAHEALETTRDLPAEDRAPAHLAYGMALALADPVHAREPLELARRLFRETYNAFLAAQAELYLAYTYVAVNDSQLVRAVLGAAYETLGTLPASALRLLSGPEEAFRPVWALWWGEQSPLELRLLGRQEVWWRGEKLTLFPQWLDILTVLALKSRPLTLEQLLAELYGDGGSKSTLKASLSKLRQVLPVSSHPYRLTAPVQADFLEVLRQLEQGDVQGPLRRYRGPLLPGSQVSCIRAHDELLTEWLRRAALAAGGPEPLLHLSELLPDDLELLENAAARLDADDPRTPLVQTRLEQVRRTW